MLVQRVWGNFIPGSQEVCGGGAVGFSLPPCAGCRTVTPVTAPVNIVAPSILGEPEVGNTLTANVGVWSPSSGLTFSYQWFSDDVEIPGATSSTYVPTVEDLGMPIRVVVTATNIAGSDDANSNTVIVVSAPVNTVPPVITGVPEVGNTLSVSDGTWYGTSPITYTYQWQQDGVDIPGATNATYLVDAADEGTTISAIVTATNSEGSADAEAEGVEIGTAPAFTAAPLLSGTPVVGQILSVTNGTVTGTAPITYTYAWFVDGSVVVGETASTYTVQAGDEGLDVYAEVTATNAFGAASDDSNVLTIATVPVNTVAPSISGPPEVGETLTANPGTWTGTAPITYTYQWQFDDGSGYVDIPGATGSTYVPTSDVIG